MLEKLGASNLLPRGRACGCRCRLHRHMHGAGNKAPGGRCKEHSQGVVCWLLGGRSFMRVPGNSPVGLHRCSVEWEKGVGKPWVAKSVGRQSSWHAPIMGACKRVCCTHHTAVQQGMGLASNPGPALGHARRTQLSHMCMHAQSCGNWGPWRAWAGAWRRPHKRHIQVQLQSWGKSQQACVGGGLCHPESGCAVLAR